MYILEHFNENVLNLFHWFFTASQSVILKLIQWHATAPHSFSCTLYVCQYDIAVFTWVLTGSQKVSMFTIMSIDIHDPSLLSSCASGELLLH